MILICEHCGIPMRGQPLYDGKDFCITDSGDHRFVYWVPEVEE